jgi:phage shock protein PspC (stress-responsive transcriptional regulator)
MELEMQSHEVQAPNSTIEPHVALPLRAHTILGVCEGLGEDFGINPIWFRVPLAAMVLYSPLIAIGSYFALGAVVLASRLLFPRAKAEQVSAPARQSDNDQADRLSIAA